MAEEPEGEWPETGAGEPAGSSVPGQTSNPELNSAPIVEFWIDTNIFGMMLAECASIPNLITQSYVFEVKLGKARIKGKQLAPDYLVKDLDTGWFASFKAMCGAQIPGKGVIPVAVLVTLSCPAQGVNFAGRVTNFPLVQSNAALVNLMEKTPPEMRQEYVKVKFENGAMSIKFCNRGGGIIVLNNPGGGGGGGEGGDRGGKSDLRIVT